MFTRLLTINELSRLLDLPYQRIEAMVRRGRLIPNSICGHSFLFDSSRVREIGAVVRENLRNAAAGPD